MQTLFTRSSISYSNAYVNDCFCVGQNVRPLNKREYILDIATEAEPVDTNYSLWFRRVIWSLALKLDNELYVTMHYNQVELLYAVRDSSFPIFKLNFRVLPSLAHILAVWLVFTTITLSHYRYYLCNPYVVKHLTDHENIITLDYISISK